MPSSAKISQQIVNWIANSPTIQDMYFHPTSAGKKWVYNRFESEEGEGRLAATQAAFTTISLLLVIASIYEYTFYAIAIAALFFAYSSGWALSATLFIGSLSILFYLLFRFTRSTIYFLGATMLTSNTKNVIIKRAINAVDVPIDERDEFLKKLYKTYFRIEGIDDEPSN